MSEALTRQKDIIPMEVLDQNITIIGAGAIGGWTTLALAKMGFANLSVWDFDEVDMVNMNSQLYRLSDIGRPKVWALQEIVKDFTGVTITANNRPYERGRFDGIVIAAVDSMKVRALIWDQHKGWPLTRLLIDPRMGAESALLYSVRPGSIDDVTAYEKTFYSDEEAVQERCTAKATIYTANLLSGLVCKAVKDELTAEAPLKSVQWDILKNDFLGFNRKVG
jgi:molybdopterin/thiamine biosynthesis adenylyltransferase